MASLNLCQFIGNVGADPEVRIFEGGSKIATTRIAVTETYTDRNQQKQQKTEWIGLVFSGKQADVVETYVKKGSPIYVQGKWRTREWTDQSGAKRSLVEVQVREFQLLPRPQQTDQQGAAVAPQAPAQPAPAPQYQAPAPAPTPAPQPPAQPAPRGRAQYQGAPAPPQPQPTPAPTPVPPGGYVPQPQDDDIPF